MPLGSPAVGGTLVSLPANTKVATKFNRTGSEPFDRIAVYIGGGGSAGSGSQSARVSLWYDAGGDPSMMIISSEVKVINWSDPVGWVIFQLPQTVNPLSGDYHLVIHGGTVNNVIRYAVDTASGVTQIVTDTFSDNEDEPFALPTAPTQPGNNYSIPGGATSVSTQAALETQLAIFPAKDIKVLNGTYSRATPLSPAAAHRIWCETYNGVTFNWGWQWEYKQGWEMHGGNYNVPDVTHAGADGTSFCVGTWLGSLGFGGDGVCSDMTIDGAGLVAHGLRMATPNNAKVDRIKVRNVTDYGLFLSDNDPASAQAAHHVYDLDVANVFRSTRGGADGTAEFAFWAGVPILNDFRRGLFRNVGWGGIWTGNRCYDTNFKDFDVDISYSSAGAPVGAQSQVAVYLERFTRRCNFRRFRLGPDILTGYNAEWDIGLNDVLSAPVTLPASTIVGMNTSAFAGSGTLYVNTEGAAVTVGYTGKTANSFTGVTGGSGTHAVGEILSSRIDGNQALGDCVFENGIITIDNVRHPTQKSWGLFFGDGSVRPVVREVYINGYNYAAIVDNTRRHNSGAYAASPTNTTLVTRNIRGSGLAGSKLISYVHPNDGGP